MAPSPRMAIHPRPPIAAATTGSPPSFDRALLAAAVALIGVGAGCSRPCWKNWRADAGGDPPRLPGVLRRRQAGAPGPLLGLNLSDAGALTAIQRAVIPKPVGANGYMPLINPPFAAVAFAPIAHSPAQAARAAWAVLSLAMLALAGAWIAAPLPTRERIATALLVALSFPSLPREGQWSAVMLLGGVRRFPQRAEGRGISGARAGHLVAQATAPRPSAPRARTRPEMGGDRLGGLGGLLLALVSVPFVGWESMGSTSATCSRWLRAISTGQGPSSSPSGRATWRRARALTGCSSATWDRAPSRPSTCSGPVGRRLRGTVAGGGHRRGTRIRDPPGAAPARGGVGIVLLVNPNLFVQDCVLVFLLLPALWPLRVRDSWRGHRSRPPGGRGPPRPVARHTLLHDRLGGCGRRRVRADDRVETRVPPVGIGRAVNAHSGGSARRPAVVLPPAVGQLHRRR